MRDDTMHEDEPCPKCGEYEVLSRHCDEIQCEDGWCDEYEDDPINYSPGEKYTRCNECLGTGILRWCRKCGFDITAYEFQKRSANS